MSGSLAHYVVGLLGREKLLFYRRWKMPSVHSPNVEHLVISKRSQSNTALYNDASTIS